MPPRFASFATNGAEQWGRVEDGYLVALTNLFPTLSAAIAARGLDDPMLHSFGGDQYALTDIKWRPVIPHPGKILCIGLNYAKHREETGRAIVDHPTVFTRFSDSQTAHDAKILMPVVSDKLDYEGELAIVIGRGGRYIADADALSHVAGYSIYNDASVRDWQAHTHQFIPGKNFPETGAFGPWLVPASHFTPTEQRLQTRLNGQVMQDARLSQMIFPIRRLIAYCSAFTPLAPGDVIVTGTPGGVGAKRNPPVFMRVGDTVEVEIEGIGVLTNGIIEG